MDLDLSILVISYNTRQLTLECLRSVLRQTSAAAVRFEIVVVDNDSTDGSADAVALEFPGVRLFRLPRNIGFAAANNLAARQARGQRLLLLNSDTVILDRAIERLWAFALQHPASIVGGRTFFPDGRLNPTSCHGFPTAWSGTCMALGLSSLFRRSRWFSPESLGRWQRDSVRRVPVVTGCFLMIERAQWQRLGGFDEAFFMYGEETDLCMRAAGLGIERLLCPDARIIHLGGASERARADKMVRLFQAKALLYRKHWGTVAASYGVLMLRLWALSRAIAFRLPALAGHRTSADLWTEIWRRRDEYRLPAAQGEEAFAASASVRVIPETSPAAPVK